MSETPPTITTQELMQAVNSSFCRGYDRAIEAVVDRMDIAIEAHEAADLCEDHFQAGLVRVIHQVRRIVRRMKLESLDLPSTKK